MPKQEGYPRRAICKCGEVIVPTGGTLGACWEHELTFLNRCSDGSQAGADKVTDRGHRPRRKTNKKDKR